MKRLIQEPISTRPQITQWCIVPKENTIKSVNSSPKMTYCLFCMRSGHLTSDCWNKNKYIKEINRDNNGKFRKTYVSRYQPAEKIYVSNKNKERKTSKKKDEGKLCKNRNITDDEKDEKHHVKPKNKQTSDIEIVKEVPKCMKQNQIPNPSTSYNKCENCVKWELRLQQCLKDKDCQKLDNAKVVKSLTEEIMQLRRQRDSWKTLYLAKE